MKRPLLIAVFTVMSGCAASYTEPTLPADHPANPNSPQTPPSVRRSVLSPESAGAVQGAKAGADGGTPTQASGPAKAYACPMHPNVTSDKPDQRCPECGMKLTLRSETGGPK